MISEAAQLQTVFDSHLDSYSSAFFQRLEQFSSAACKRLIRRFWLVVSFRTALPFTISITLYPASQHRVHFSASLMITETFFAAILLADKGPTTVGRFPISYHRDEYVNCTTTVCTGYAPCVALFKLVNVSLIKIYRHATKDRQSAAFPPFQIIS